MSDVIHHAKRAVDKVKHDTDEAGDSILASAGHIAEKVKDAGVHAVDFAKAQYEHARDAYDHARDAAKGWSGDVRKYVRREPLKSVLFGMGVGLIVGALWRRR